MFNCRNVLIVGMLGFCLDCKVQDENTEMKQLLRVLEDISHFLQKNPYFFSNLLIPDIWDKTVT